VHREPSLPRVGCWVNKIHGPQLAIAAARGSCLSMEPEKIRPIAGNDRPILVSPRGSVVEALGVCGKGLRRTAWEPLADFGVRSDSMSDVRGDVQCRISTLSTVANFWEVTAAGI
jgi:hypothetical protein